jgi:hypothetical protein
MSTDIVATKLDELAEMKAASKVLFAEMERRRAEIMAPILPDLEALVAEFSPKTDAAAQREAQLEGEVKALVIGAGESVKGARLHAVYSKGRVTWDGKKLDGMMSLIPQLADARKEGEPSVTIRAVK